MKKKINIIGAGIAGLSAGCYLQMHGYDTEIFELHDLPGGLCTSWDRKGYTIDACIHWLVGSSPSYDMYNLWNELIDMKTIDFVEHDLLTTLYDKSGNQISLYTDIDKFENELLSKGPEDKELILKFTNSVRKFLNLDLPNNKANELFSFSDNFRMFKKIIPYLFDLNRWMKIDASEYAEKCKNPLIKLAFENLFVPEMSCLFIVFMLVWFHKKSAGYPIGGSLKFAQRIEATYLKLGGKINYKSRVEKIIYEKNLFKSFVKGIELENGSKHYSDITISAADGFSTIFKMLDGKFLSNQIKDFYKNKKLFPSLVLVSLGVARKFENVPPTSIYLLNNPIKIDDKTESDALSVRIMNYDHTLAPEGKTLITCMYGTYNYEYWVNLKNENPHKYKAEKDRIASETIELLEQKYGNIKNNIEMIDVSTPSTYIRYTNNWKGSFEGWLMTPDIGLKQISKTLPTLHNFYMIGQWVIPGGGLPSGLISGRDVAQIICHKDKIPFEPKQH